MVSLQWQQKVIIFYFQQRCSENSGKCIPIFWHCNGKIDCPQGSDELNCPCEKYKMKECLIKTNISLCVPESWICNHHITCLQYNQDNCQVPGHSETRCGLGQFLCHINETCISQQRVCDGTPDCKGKEDEVFCSGGIAFCSLCMTTVN